MKTLSIPPLALAVLAPTVLSAQTVFDEGAREAAEAVAEAAVESANDRGAMAEATTAPALSVSLVPPKIGVVPARARKTGPRDPVPQDHRSLRVPHAAYPLAAWRAGEEGSVGYEIEVDKIGRAKSCVLVQTSGSDLLDQATCPAMMESVVFLPAVDEDGKAVRGAYKGVANWQIKQPEVPPMQAIFRYRHDATGETSDCEFVQLEGELPEKMRREIERDMARGDGCPGGSRRGRGIPYRDSEGNPVAKIVTIKVQIEVEDLSE